MKDHVFVVGTTANNPELARRQGEGYEVHSWQVLTTTREQENGEEIRVIALMVKDLEGLVPSPDALKELQGLYAEFPGLMRFHAASMGLRILGPDAISDDEKLVRILRRLNDKDMDMPPSARMSMEDFIEEQLLFDLKVKEKASNFGDRVRTKNALTRQHIYIFSDLRWALESGMSIRNVGPKGREFCKQLLAENSISK